MQKSQTKRGGLPCETSGIFERLDCQNAVFRCSRYVALPAIIPHGRGEGERFVYSGDGDVGYSVSQDTGVIVLAGNRPGTYDTNGVRYIVRRGICYLSVCCGGTWNVGSIGTTAKQIAILPEGARPVIPVECWSRKP